LVSQNYFGGQRLTQEKEQELLNKIRKKLHQELNNIDRELKTGEYTKQERADINEYQAELREGLRAKNYEELSNFSFTSLLAEELDQLRTLSKGKGQGTGNNTSYDLSRSDLVLL